MTDTTALALDKEGFLAELKDWSEPVAEILAGNEGLTLTPPHWEIIHLLRDFYAATEVSPAMRPLVKLVKDSLGKDKGNSIYLMELFGSSPAKIAAKCAGLPRPTNCL